MVVNGSRLTHARRCDQSDRGPLKPIAFRSGADRMSAGGGENERGRAYGRGVLSGARGVHVQGWRSSGVGVVYIHAEPQRLQASVRRRGGAAVTKRKPPPPVVPTPL